MKTRNAPVYGKQESQSTGLAICRKWEKYNCTSKNDGNSKNREVRQLQNAAPQIQGDRMDRILTCDEKSGSSTTTVKPERKGKTPTILEF